MLVARSLQYYKRRDVQDAILRHAEHREVSPRYGEGFGKRPDALFNPTDILEFAKRRSTSFHCSEERWENPLNIQTGANRKDVDALRIGWDLVLDIDAPNWELSRLTAWTFIQTLRAHGIKSISVKFSGNKGWHIGVPWESFPSHILGHDGQKDIPTKDLFPELPRAIAGYMLDFMGNPNNGILTIRDDLITFGGDAAPTSSSVRTTYTVDELAAIAHKPRDVILQVFCPTCNKFVKRNEESFSLQCYHCQYRDNKKYSREEKEMFDEANRKCPQCKHLLEFISLAKSNDCAHNPNSYTKRLKLAEVIEVDTILIAGRHLYRMPYSLHEKSGLSSVVILPDEVLDFDKKMAEPATVDLSRTFLDSATIVHGDATQLASVAWQWQGKKESTNVRRNATQQNAELEVITDAIAKEHFPPCMLNILAGGMLDGKKRSMFALTNFLVVCGWSPDMIEAELHAWNSKNPEPLREVVIKGHMRQVRMKPERILPPSCKEYYQSMNLCKPNEFCSQVRNPAQYALKHVKLGEKPKRRKKTDDDDYETPYAQKVAKQKEAATDAATEAAADVIVKIGKAKKGRKQENVGVVHEEDGKE